jgi:hypothetical protein
MKGNPARFFVFGGRFSLKFKLPGLFLEPPGLQKMPILSIFSLLTA